MLGSAGVGLVWGWFMGNLSGRIQRPIFDGLAFSIATLLLAAEMFLMVNWMSLVLFLSTAGISLMIHLGWRRDLCKRFGPPRC
jgi:hypothetical protein